MDLSSFIKYTGFNKSSANGKGIGIAIIDSGCNSKNDNIVFSFNAYNKTNNIQDRYGHGSHIYEIINYVAPKSNYYIFKGMDDFGDGDARAIYESLIRCKNNDGIHIICLSLSSFHDSKAIRKIINECLGKGKVIVSSLGNDSTSKPTFPSSIEGVYSVGALDRSLEKRYGKSNYSNSTSFVALGEGVMGQNGTSFANAIVIGQIAIIMSENNIYHNPSYEYFKKYFHSSNRTMDMANGLLYNKQEERND